MGEVLHLNDECLWYSPFDASIEASVTEARSFNEAEAGSFEKEDGELNA
jgi:hypothetical protein